MVLKSFDRWGLRHPDGICSFARIAHKIIHNKGKMPAFYPADVESLMKQSKK